MYDLDTVTQNIGLHLYELWQKSGMSQESFAAAIGISASTLYTYIYGKRIPNLSTLVCIANELDISLGSLFEDKAIDFADMPAAGLNKRMALYLCRNCRHAKGSKACIRCKIKRIERR